MSKPPVKIADQPRLSLRRIAQITADGIRYRVFRCAVTVAVIAVAVAFLNNIVSESLVRRSVATVSRNRLIELHRVHEWAARLTTPGTLASLLDEVAGSVPDDPVYRECARFGGFDAAAMAAFHRATRDAQPYLRFFDRLDYDLRRRLVHTAQGPAVFDRLATDAGMDEFRQGLDAMKAVRFVSSIEALQRFLNNDWARLKQNAQQVLAGQHAAVDAMRGALAGESVLAALAGAEGAFGAAVRGAGFEFDRESVAPQVAQQAQRLLAMQRVEQCIEVESVRQLVSRDANVAPSDVTSIHLWRFLRNAANARALLAEAARGGHALTDRDRDLTALARQRTEERVLARIRRNTMEMGSGWLGMGERMGWLISVSMLVCGIGITNAMLVSVTERFREIATLKCLGALDGFILILFVFESCILGVAGGFLGALLGSLIGVGRAISEFGFALPGGLPVTALLSGGALSIGAGVILAALAAVYPALKASRLAPMEAMRID